ncbi:hypothetical protein GEPA3_1530 [Geobacillus sp. PA-3]|nr:hypothetical protein GEPA3_1530 [Geobacillus sp. PA-3]
MGFRHSSETHFVNSLKASKRTLFLFVWHEWLPFFNRMEIILQTKETI